MLVLAPKAYYHQPPTGGLNQGPSLFGTRDLFHEDNFTMVLGRGGGLGMIQAPYVHCAPCFCYYDISSTQDHQAIDPRGRGPPV